ncbi:alanine racemase [Chondromyces crocatus]|uniref:Alanine racemase n=1 Tax=Chondromyces crocatus TaxID=52 RepID=A0A0K1ERK0_CHOCO|nr:alanine racemase [Chondromyces crocatus]AKT43277.1 alanine racemase [Chondromyces crocatus]
MVRVLYPRRAAPASAIRPTRAEINLASLRHNLNVLSRSIQASQPRTSHPQIWGVLKADAYGHGAPAVARTLERAGITGLCVALLEEAVELREAGIRIPILVMGGYYGLRNDGMEELIARNLTPVIYSAAQVEKLAAIASYRGSKGVDVHLKADTGMGRLGVDSSEFQDVLDAIARTPMIRLQGLMTHLACADADDLHATNEQLSRFMEIERRVRAAGLTPTLRHAANSAALFRLPASRLDMVRPGIALFGLEPRVGLAPELRPVMSVRSEIVAIRKIEEGHCVGYGYTWKATRPSMVATVPMGYADGLSRNLSNRGSVLVHGKRAAIAGTISMDLTVIDVTDVPCAKIGDEVVFLGSQEGSLGQASITAVEMADLSGTISWEVLTSISRRVPRFYREP